MSDALPPDFLERLKAAVDGREGRSAGQEVLFLCPDHDDHHPSARYHPSKAVWCCDVCGAGGGALELAQRLGIEVPKRRSSGLTVEELARAKGLPVEFLHELGVTDGWAGYSSNRQSCVDVPYLDAQGEVVVVRKRLSLTGEPRFRWRRGDKVVPYGLSRLKDAKATGYLLIVEGESDAWTCWNAAIPALGMPGAATWKDEWASHLAGIAIVAVWREPDAGGDTLAANVAASLPDVQIIEAPVEAKDPSALWLAGDGDLDAFRARMRDLAKAARPASELRAEALSEEACEALVQTEGLLDHADILDVVGKSIRDLGYAGDLAQPLLLYLAITSRLLIQPVNVVLYGPSAGGKTFMVETVTTLFPRAAIYDATASSERAWVYTTEEFRHRSLIIGESAALHRDGVGATIIRSIAWGGKIMYDTVEKTADGLSGRRIEKEGPTGIVTTATKPLEGELGTRFLTIDVPDDPAQTKAILAATAGRASGALSSPRLEPMVAIQEWLQLVGAKQVIVPFAPRLSLLFPAEIVRVRRDFTHLLTLVQAHALLHQRTRRLDHEGRVLAELDDYRAVYHLASSVFAALSAGGVTDTVRQTVRVAVALYDVQHPVSVTALATKLEVHRTRAYRRAVRACELGYLVNTETRPGRPLQLIPGEPLPDERPALPHPDDVGDVCDHPPENARNRATEAPEPTGAESGGAVAASGATLGATDRATSGSDSAPDSRQANGCAVALEIGGYNTDGCIHRPPYESDYNRAEAITRPDIWGWDAAECKCCAGPVREELYDNADRLCPNCHLGRPAPERGGHLVRLALDLGGRLVEEDPGVRQAVAAEEPC